MDKLKSSLQISNIIRLTVILSVIISIPVMADWVVMQKTDPEIRDYMAIVFTGKKTGWVAGSAPLEDFENLGFIGYTIDGGVTWQKSKIQLGADLTGIYFLDSNHGWVVGQKGIIANTTNGKDWDIQISKVGTWLKSIHFVNKNIGYAAGENGTFLSTRNGGRVWKVLEGGQVGEGVGENDSSLYNAIQFLDEKTGWVAGVRLMPTKKSQASLIQKTIDGAKTWVIQETGTEDILEDIFFIDASTGWAVGDNGVILHTNNGGDHWNMQTSGTQEKLRSIRFADKNVGWAVGGDFGVGVTLSTTDGGNTWTVEESREAKVKVFVLDKQNTWVAGATGSILKAE